MEERITVNGTEYRIKKLLGKGKGGYSFLAEKEGMLFVIKQIHHEPCGYYTFGNKIESEKNDYKRLVQTGISVPELITVDDKEERILKEFIDGPTVLELVKNDRMKSGYFEQVRIMCGKLYSVGLNIDYFPTNFIVRDEQLFYIDYECNSYMEEWNFENWGIKYWSKTEEFIDFVSRNGL